MVSEEYMNTIDNLINSQNNYFNMFLAILSVMLTVFLFLIGFFQWRLSDKQVEKIKAETEKKLLDQFNSKLEESRNENMWIVLNSTRYPLFQTIDLILMTDIRLSSLPPKIEQILHSLESVKEVHDYEFKILTNTLVYFYENTDKIMDGDRDDFVTNYLSIEYIYIFVAKRVIEEQRLTEDFTKIDDGMKQFKDKYYTIFESYMSY